MSVKVLPGSFSERSTSPPNGSCEVISIKVEEGTDIPTQPKEIPVPISFPVIKAEQDEVSYMSLCLLLDTFQQYPLTHCMCPHVHLYTCPLEQLSCGEWKFLSHLGLCEYIATKFVCS
jgi:hypothetical protein